MHLISLVQSSCTKPDLEEETAQIETIQDNMQLNQEKSFLCDLGLQRQEMHSTGQRDPLLDFMMFWSVNTLYIASCQLDS